METVIENGATRLKNILINCEFSAVVREAFKKKGYNAVSCDHKPSRIPGNFHIRADALDVAYNPKKYGVIKWDGMIAFPPCTYVCFAGIRWNVNNPERQKLSDDAIAFFLDLWNAPIEKICIENPVGIIPGKTGIKWSQIIHPYYFGDPYMKKTCLWLKNLPLLVATDIVPVREQKVFNMWPSKNYNRSDERSITYQGIANAMADQFKF